MAGIVKAQDWLDAVNSLQAFRRAETDRQSERLNVSYKKVLKKNHTSKLFKLYKSDQFKRQKSSRHLLSPNTLSASPFRRGTKISKLSRMGPPSQTFHKLPIRTLFPEISISDIKKRTASAERAEIELTIEEKLKLSANRHPPIESLPKYSSSISIAEFRNEQLRLKRQGIVLPVRKKANRTPLFLKEMKVQSEKEAKKPKILAPYEEEKAFPLHKSSKQFNRILPQQTEIKQTSEASSESQSMEVMRRLSEVLRESVAIEMFHFENLERVRWQAPGLSTFYFNRFKGEEKYKEANSQEEEEESVSSAASEDDNDDFARQF